MCINDNNQFVFSLHSISLYRYTNLFTSHLLFSGGSDGKASAYKVGDPGSIPGLGRSSEEEMATHSSTLAWKISWTEETGRLQSMGSQSWTRLSDFTFHFHLLF